MQEMHVGTIPEREGRSTDASTLRQVPTWYPIAKRLLDIVGSFVGIILFAPLMAVVALAIRIDSPGPILFRQIRAGKGGTPFAFLKFRSMRQDAEKLLPSLRHLNETTGPIFKMQKDPRVTRVGRFIRKYSLDELPQLFNVLRGDLSLVGPRPHTPEEVKVYKPFQMKRLSVPPGIICLREVSGRSKFGFDEWIALDLEYVERQSFWLDLHILLRVIPAVLSHDGAC